LSDQLEMTRRVYIALSLLSGTCLILGVYLYSFLNIESTYAWPAAIGFTSSVLFPLTYARFKFGSLSKFWELMSKYSQKHDGFSILAQKIIYVLWLTFIVLIDMYALYQLNF